jgi:TonB-dependent starch-binding outer membrane protein SusC
VNFVNNFGHTWDTLSNYQNVAPVNWQDEVLGNTGVLTTHSLSGSGGTQHVIYSFGYTFNDDKAIVINSSYRRHLLNFKNDYIITSKLKAGIGVNYMYQDVFGAGVSDTKGSSYNRLRNAVKYRPFLSPGMDLQALDPLADPNPGNGLGLVNPIDLANSEYRLKKTSDLNYYAYAQYNILRNLTFKSTFGLDYNVLRDLQYSDTLTPYSVIQGAKKPIAQLDTTTKRSITNSNVLTYSIKNFRGKHDFDFLVGEETYELATKITNELFKGFPSFTGPNAAFKQFGLATPFAGYPKLTKTRETHLSFFSRLNYSFLDKYLFSFNFRADGSSKFMPGIQWAYFPSGSFAWRVKNEKFLQNVNFINDLKFRVGFGTAGNDRIGDYQYLTSFNYNTYYYGINNQIVPGYSSGNLSNPLLKWESTVNRNYGVDITLFQHRINLSVDYYDNSSKDLLLNVPIAATYGYSTQFQNIGKTSNKGIDLQLSADIIKKKNFKWSANFNISHNVNKVVALGINQTTLFPPASWGVSGQPTDYVTQVGQPVGSMWGLVADGFYKVSDFDYNAVTSVYTLKSGVVSDAAIIGVVQPGSIKFKDLNGDGIVDLNNDRKIIGNPTPKFTGGLYQQFNYKNWDLSIFANFSYGNDIYNANKIEFTNGYINNSNMLEIMSGRWKVVTATGQTAQWVNGTQVLGIPPDQLAALNAGATIWQPLKSAGAFYPSSWAIEDGSFLRINNATLGYTLPNLRVEWLKISKLRFYITGNNLHLFTKYTGYDPEVNVASNPLTPGLDYSAYPKSRSFIFGLNATF